MTTKDEGSVVMAKRFSGAGSEVAALDVAFFASATHGLLQGQAMVSGQIALREMGIQGIPVHIVENACTTGA